MASYDDITLALLNRAATLSVGSPALPIAMPERAFTPPTDGKYLDVKDFTNVPAWSGLNGGKIDQGILQIDVVWTRGEGLIAAKAAASAICDHFPAGHVMRQGSAAVKVSQDPWASSPISDTSELRIPVSIPWTA